MAWVRLADDFYDHPKLVGVGPVAGWMWVCGLAYANRYLTDGYLPSAAVRRLADVDDPFRLAARLVDARLWDTADGGYRIHDYATYQPSADAVKAERTKTAERVAAWRERRSNAVTNDVRNGVGNAVSNAAPGPGPDPDPVPGPDPSGTTPQPPSPAALRAAKGGRNSGRRGRNRGAVRDSEDTTAPPEVTAPLTQADRELWHEAIRLSTHDMLPAHRAKLAALQPVGRGADGGLLLRSPPRVGMDKYRSTLQRALLDAGDDQAAHVVIFEG